MLNFELVEGELQGKENILCLDRIQMCNLSSTIKERLLESKSIF